MNALLTSLQLFLCCPQLFGAVESGPIEVYARELGNNIPRNKVFKNYRGGDFSLRSRDKAADVPEVPQVILSTTTASSCTSALPSAMDVANDADAGNESPARAAPALSADAVEPNNECDNTSSEASSEMSVVDNENSAAESTEGASESVHGGEGSSQQPSHLQLGATLHTSKDYFLASDETVFVGTKKYSELFTFWQVKIEWLLVFRFLFPKNLRFFVFFS